MPTYRYECRMCGQPFQLDLPMHARYSSAECPYCMTSGAETLWDPKTESEEPKLRILPPRVQIMKHQADRDAEKDGGVFDHALGAAYRTHAERAELIERLPEKIFNETRGKHSTIRPFHRDEGDPDSPIVFDKVTTEGQGFDMGRVVEADVNPHNANEDRLTKEQRRVEAHVGPALEGFPDKVRDEAARRGIE